MSTSSVYSVAESVEYAGSFLSTETLVPLPQRNALPSRRVVSAPPIATSRTRPVISTRPRQNTHLYERMDVQAFSKREQKWKRAGAIFARIFVFLLGLAGLVLAVQIKLQPMKYLKSPHEGTAQNEGSQASGLMAKITLMAQQLSKMKKELTGKQEVLSDEIFRLSNNVTTLDEQIISARRFLAAKIQGHPRRVRLADGGDLYGRVEVYHDGQWGTICDNDWDIQDASVICRQLDMGTAVAAPRSAANGKGSGRIWMDNINCLGTEKSVTHCAYDGWGIRECTHSQDASVVCSG